MSEEIAGFRAPWWCMGGHLQTLAAAVARPGPGGFEAVRIPIEVGALTGRWYPPHDPSKGAAIVIHGIGGDATAPFVGGTVRALLHRGVGALAIDLRGMGGSTDVEGPPLFHAGLTQDLKAAVAWLRARVDVIHLVGFSLGGQLVLRTAGEVDAAGEANFGSVTAVCPPVDLMAGACFTERAVAFPYRKAIVDGLHERLRRVSSKLPRDVLEAGLRARTIREFDAAAVVPLFGFRDVADYYARCSSNAVAADIRSPTLVLMADDDPIVPAHPVEALRGNAAIKVVRTGGGGHCGYYSRAVAPGDASRWWAEERAAAWCVSGPGSR